ncbi:GNAT family N-acetyltransferase [Streptomyces tubbatahanensis]|uniref:GNAT family N-acetyltransferase n=1 Tax=Streptomyces tubbatahanensis TaxID=2923272 RepID=A0ABY3XVL1_9ACTN|nr:GNAT family N-acetyltransferase [Streptomyces tubbatahanensis]UNS98475.1 GNAT family N-acetyltransferase [Streptomyces tubbatahanensis]
MVGVTWTIGPESVTSPDAVEALVTYTTEMASRYYGRPATGPEVDSAVAEHPVDDLVPPRGRFLLARADKDGTVAGCIAVALVSEHTAEIRRFWVAPHTRRGGLGALLVAAAENAALGMGARAVRLDTRRDLTEARRLYARLGYEEIEPFNDSPYADHWFGKPLRRKLGHIPEQAASPE